MARLCHRRAFVLSATIGDENTRLYVMEIRSMLRSLLMLLAVVILLLVVVVFALGNPGTIELDLAFGKYEVKTALAFAIAIAGGWVWGVLSVAAYIFKLWGERRALRKRIRLADAELNNLRALPMHDAG